MMQEDQKEKAARRTTCIKQRKNRGASRTFFFLIGLRQAKVVDVVSTATIAFVTVEYRGVAAFVPDSLER